ncbi:MAG TPA: acetoin dehydrogenase dihydrolipoyllysine-residue acetyltransferase subunit [Ramlibacter sp.]|uniref:acetoin dehydrogenase dihydrolipoyllysine-residue acetyltransferase subunit n=1 Tax=Ramlibacter sp. TaxID=1917967 RepID=UPI002D7ECF91|nr:acetoin dehydrogenase dihydrolipoyllysine-residue acetyltransferase subunit [Ramlibacter sp.]HET8745915.1 acetoin dehydrogenase dihydrolipoyllysine-residue acetyltransferase subunit [Ramlibacter sp.]
MTAPQITPLVMPKWGLEMREGTVAGWLVEEGARIEVGTPVVDVETDKISNAVEAPDPGLLRRKVAKDGETLPVKALLGVLAEADVPEADIDAYIAAYEVPAAGDDDEDAGPDYEWVEVGGIRVRHARRGPEAGVPVLFLHGYGGDLGNWLFNLDALGAVAPVIALDLPGHGQSDARLPGASLADLSSFVAAFLAQIGVERVHVVGHSMGGAIGAQLALDQPARVASLALLNPAGLGTEINGDYTQGFARAASRRELKPLVELLFADPSLASRQMVDDLLKYKRMDGVGELLETLQGTLFPNGRQAETPGLRLGESDVPLLVVWGAQDRIIPPAHATNAPRRALVEVLEGAGHMAMMEKAGEVNTLLKRHIGA